MNLVWHYTTGENFQAIVADGWLDPKKTVSGRGERQALWFSADQFWEATAQKLLYQPGTGMCNTGLGMDGTYKHGGGLVRFGVSKSHVIPWAKLARKASMHPEDARRLERSGIQQGANPTQWFGSFKRIRVRDCVVEVFTLPDTWERVE